MNREEFLEWLQVGMPVYIRKAWQDTRVPGGMLKVDIVSGMSDGAIKTYAHGWFSQKTLQESQYAYIEITSEEIIREFAEQQIAVLRGKDEANTN